MTDDVLLHEPEFDARRRAVLGRFGGVLLVFALGLALVAVAREIGPATEEVAIAVFAVGLLASMLWLWRTARRIWRCPACDARWELGQALASTHWNHCPACGAALRALARRSDRERQHLEAYERGESGAKQARDALGVKVAAITLALVGMGMLAWSSAVGGSRLLQQLAVAVLAGAGTVAAVLAARCPRCGRGGAAAAGGHCVRCGLAR